MTHCVIVSYSHTGNNAALADRVAKDLSAEQIRVDEQKPRTTGTIFMDLLFNRTPRVLPAPNTMDPYDLVLFFGPVWVGKTASPLRAYFNHLKTNPKRYGFFSICGGTDGGNTKLSGELEKRTGAKPELLLDLHITDLFSPQSEPERKDTSAYRINEADIEKLAGIVLEKIRAVN